MRPRGGVETFSVETSISGIVKRIWRALARGAVERLVYFGLG